MLGVAAEAGALASFGFIFALYKGWLPFAYDANALVKIVIGVIGFIIFAYSFGESRLNLFHRVTGLRASWMPVYVSRLGFVDTLSIIFLILLKYPFQYIGLVSKYEIADDGKHIKFKEIKLSSGIQLDEGDYKRYDAATSPTTTAKNPKNAAKNDRMLLLPALTTPMMLVLMANRHCPVLPFGSVNTGNRFEFIDPEACRDPLNVLDLGHKAVVSARVGGDQLLGRRVKRGVEFDVVVELKAPHKGQPQAQLVFRQVITILAFLPKTFNPTYDESAATTDKDLQVNWAKQPHGAVSLTTTSPSNWAKVCSDYNPIHVSTSMAKVFGFPGKIAHGNHVVASAISELQATKDLGAAERGFKNLLTSKQPSYVEVQFKRPMVLPTNLVVRYGSSKDMSNYAFVTEKGDKEYVFAKAGELRT